MKTPILIKAFQIFKQGMTDKPVTILVENANQIPAKKEKYIALGYTVTDIK